MLRSISDLDDIQYYGKKVLVRVDFNVTINNGAVTEDYRLRSAIPTIEYLVKRGAKVILASHLDRPSGKELKYSLRRVSKKLGEMLSSFNAGVTFSADCIGKDTLDLINGLKNGDVLLLENLRFYSEEEKNDPVFSKKLAN